VDDIVFRRGYAARIHSVADWGREMASQAADWVFLDIPVAYLFFPMQDGEGYHQLSLRFDP
jgi:hypothetical protein